MADNGSGWNEGVNIARRASSRRAIFSCVDERHGVNCLGSRVYGSKYRSITGTEFFPVLRFAEVILIRAEALAHLTRLPEAVTELNRIRTRAGVPAFVLGTHTAQEVIDAIVTQIFECVVATELFQPN